MWERDKTREKFVSLLVLAGLFNKIEIEEAGQKGPLFTNYSPIAQLVRAPH